MEFGECEKRQEYSKKKIESALRCSKTSSSASELFHEV